MQFLHQCHLSKSLPLTYSTIQTIPNKYYVVTDIFHYRLLANLAEINWITIFLHFTAFQKALVIPISFPDVIGTLPPTVRTTLVNAIPAFRIAEKSTLTHETFAIDNRCRAGFLPFYIMSQINPSHFANIPKARNYFAYFCSGISTENINSLLLFLFTGLASFLLEPIQ